MNSYQKFEQMMYDVGEDIISKLHKNYALAWSGGLDSTALLFVCLKQDKPFIAVHIVDDNNLLRNRQERMFSKAICEDLSFRLGVPTLFIPREYKGPGGLYKAIAKYGFRDVLSGNGMDRCYGFDILSTFGSDVRANHPVIEIFGRTFPKKFKHFKEYNYKRDHPSDETSKTLQSIKEVNVVLWSAHPLFEEYFSNEYEETIDYCFFPKKLTMKFVSNHLGVPFNKYCREVYKKNRRKLEPFGYRLLKHLQGETVD